MILNTLKKDHAELNGWVIDNKNYHKQNGDIYLSPSSFYQKNAFALIKDVRLETEKLSAVKIKWQRGNLPAG